MKKLSVSCLPAVASIVRSTKFIGLLAKAGALCFVLGAPFAYGAGAPNPRGVRAAPQTPRAEKTAPEITNRTAATRTVSRSATVGARTPAIAPPQQSRSAVAARSATAPVAASSARSASVSRSATPARAATAVFGDLSKLGTGYNNCREAYNTCMDQFCAAANDTYRRCICSEKFRDFGDMEAALDQAKTMLQSFADNNLEAVNLTAAEVGAMQTATAGEAAMRTDKSAAAKMLDEIGDLLSGKKKPSQAQQPTRLDFSNLMNFGSAIDDIWGGGSDDMFGGGGRGKDLTALEGKALYDEVDRQCSSMAQAQCENAATLQMVRSAYGLVISQDCQAYSKKIDGMKEQVAQKVREANKMLRDARLEEYRTHNSASVNECIGKVQADILHEYACGPNFKRCLDFTGLYINQTTGEPIYSPLLFNLANQIKLENPNAPENKAFLNGLDAFRNRARESLDSCRDDANAVWDAFKRQALIEIAQAQDRKLEEIKMTCVTTMKECYDTIGGQLKDFDDTTSQRSGAVGARATRAMCADKVAACANLYANPNDMNCKKVDSNTIGNLRSSDAATNLCGLKELLAFVSTVDTVRIAEGCDAALESYIEEICAPASGDSENSVPYGCRLISPGKLEANLQTYAKTFCLGDPDATLDPATISAVTKAMDSLRAELGDQLQNICNDLNGVWIMHPDSAQELANKSKSRKLEIEPVFAGQVYGGLAKLKETVSLWAAGLMETGASVARLDKYEAMAVQAAERAAMVNKPIYGAVAARGAVTPANAARAAQDLSVQYAARATDSPQSGGTTDRSIGWGLCVVNTVMVSCQIADEIVGGQGLAHMDPSGTRCILDSSYAQEACKILPGGTWVASTGQCFIK
ncbi:MAG: hypothetical protein FWF97_02235 [Alphaproteobacteria bacterium]|nr:hypothetical protein [Alphaproteobacteria bacterium]